MSFRYYIIYILLISFILSLSITQSALSQPEATSSIDHSIKRAIEFADQKQKEAQREAEIINNYFSKARASYGRGDYREAIKYFEEILNRDPAYEAAKLYIESAIVHLEIQKEQAEIETIKLKMADIIAEYDRRRERAGSLAVGYFLDQAQKKCQIGDFKGADNLYNLCYKVNPHNKANIEWFVKATHDLRKLYRVLDEHIARIEELTIFES